MTLPPAPYGISNVANDDIQLAANCSAATPRTLKKTSAIEKPMSVIQTWLRHVSRADLPNVTSWASADLSKVYKVQSIIRTRSF